MSKTPIAGFSYCSFCGGPMGRISERVSVRPRVDHKRCGNVKRLLAWCSSELSTIDFNPERAAVVRSDLVQMANALPVARLANGRFQSKKRREGES